MPYNDSAQHTFSFSGGRCNCNVAFIRKLAETDSLGAGGILPLSATVASAEIFEAFQGDSKLQALLHGHSYSGHAAGASAGVAALRIFSDTRLNPALAPTGDVLQQLWHPDLVHKLSHLPSVRHVVHLGESSFYLTLHLSLSMMGESCLACVPNGDLMTGRWLRVAITGRT